MADCPIRCYIAASPARHGLDDAAIIVGSINRRRCDRGQVASDQLDGVISSGDCRRRDLSWALIDEACLAFDWVIDSLERQNASVLYEPRSRVPIDSLVKVPIVD